MAEVSVEELIRKLGDRDWQTATEAQRALVRLGRSIVPALCAVVSGDEPGIAWRAAWVLGRIGDPEAVPLLCEIVVSESLQDPTYPHVYADQRGLLRAEAAEALGRIGHSEAAASLCLALGDTLEMVRVQAAKSLEKLGVVSTSVLCERLPTLPRESATLVLLTLGMFGDTSAIPSLCDSLEHRHWTVRRAAATALGTLAERHPVPELRAAIPLLRRNLVAWPFSPAELRQTSEQALRAIELRTQDLQAVPLPSGPPAPEISSLPLPAASEDNAPQVIPETQSWGRRFREWLRR